MDKARFFKQTAKREKTIEVPGYGELEIQQLTIDERLSLPEQFDVSHGHAAVWLVCKGVVGLDVEDADNVGQMDPNIIELIGEAVLRFSGVHEDEAEEAKND
jgi:hypothetical protein